VDIAAFLGSHPPFSELSPGRLDKLARAVEIAHFPAGEVILRRGGAPATALHVVRKGAIELVGVVGVLDVLGEGEVFGEFSLLAHEAPTLTVRAHEDTLCYLIPEQQASNLLGSPEGLTFVLAAMRRRVRSAVEHAGSEHGGPALRPIRDLVRREPVTIQPGATVAEAAKRMTDERVSCLLIPMRDAWAIVTDRDLRSKVVAERGSFDRPVAEIASFPARAMAGDALAGDALLEMFATGVHHFPVTDGGRVVGVITDTDLMGAAQRTPFAVKSAIERAQTGDDVVGATSDLPAMVVGLVESNTDPVAVGRVISLVLDAATERLVALAIAALGEPPSPFAWLVLGSGARHEQALSTDQDHAIAFEPPEGADLAACDVYFAALAGAVTDGLERSGIPRCEGDAMAVHPRMRRPVADWLAAFRSWIEEPDPDSSVLSSIGSDLRRQAGSVDVEAPFDMVIRDAHRFPAFARTLGRRALDHRPPTGFFGDLVVEHRGDRSGQLDVKRGGITIVTNLARAWAIGAGSPARGTLARLEAAAGTEHLDDALAVELSQAFRFLWEVRLRHQAAQARSGQPVDDFVDPSTLGAFHRSGLKEAFRVIRHAQRALATDLGLDLS
jgi:CBS domain-containing protein